VKLSRILANQSISDGQPNGRPYQFQLVFEDAPPLRLRGASDGWTMIVDALPLDAPATLGEIGEVAIHDVTDRLANTLSGVEVQALRPLRLRGEQVGLQLVLAGGRSFNFWANDDELHWGDADALVRHDWRDEQRPVAD
jgi:hypothetical protein